MKTTSTIFRVIPAAVLVAGFSLLARNATAGFPLYPPETLSSREAKAGFMFFDDSNNGVNSEQCRRQSGPLQPGRICAAGYYLPAGFKLAKNPDNNVPMLSQGLFFSPVSFWKNTVVYNITMEPDFSGLDGLLNAYRLTLSARYGVPAETVSLSPIDTGAMQIVSRSSYGSAATPPPGATPEELGQMVALATTYTQIIAPSWTGDLHNIGSRFSISIRGPVWDLEPGLQRMFLQTAGNAAVGQVSFGIRVKAKPYDAVFKCNLKKFQDVFRSTLKNWAITRIQHGSSTWESFNNEERNAIRTQLTMDAFCDIKEQKDTTIPTDRLIEERGGQIFQKLFDSAFNKIQETVPGSLIEGKDDRYTFFSTESRADSEGNIEVRLSQDYVFFLKSDLDFYAGGVTEDNFSPAHKYLCDHFEHFDIARNSCVTVCDPGREVYLPGNPNANSTTHCLRIDTDTPIFQPPKN